MAAFLHLCSTLESSMSPWTSTEPQPPSHSSPATCCFALALVVHLSLLSVENMASVRCTLPLLSLGPSVSSFRNQLLATALCSLVVSFKVLDWLLMKLWPSLPSATSFSSMSEDLELPLPCSFWPPFQTGSPSLLVLSRPI